MNQAPVSAESVIARATYRYTKHPVRIGQVRHKVWGYLVEPSGEQDPVWVARAGNYWMIQQETFGLKFSDFTISIDWERRAIVTYAVLLDVLPGERTADFVAPRVRDQRARQQPLTAAT